MVIRHWPDQGQPGLEVDHRCTRSGPQEFSATATNKQDGMQICTETQPIRLTLCHPHTNSRCHHFSHTEPAVQVSTPAAATARLLCVCVQEIFEVHDTQGRQGRLQFTQSTLPVGSARATSRAYVLNVSHVDAHAFSIDLVHLLQSIRNIWCITAMRQCTQVQLYEQALQLAQDSGEAPMVQLTAHWGCCQPSGCHPFLN
jgi:hypothetical protein